MHGSLAAALTWLLVVAVPVQAMAATVMVHCIPGHEGSTEIHAKSTDHHHAGMASHSHEPGKAQATRHVHSEIGLVDAAAADLTNVAKCSVCASCCVGAALPATSRSIVVSPPHDSPLLSPVEHALDIFVPGPERPPRFSLS